MYTILYKCPFGHEHDNEQEAENCLLLWERAEEAKNSRELGNSGVMLV